MHLALCRLEAMAREAPVWGRALVDWYAGACREKWQRTLDLWQEKYEQALTETEQVLSGKDKVEVLVSQSASLEWIQRPGHDRS